MIIENIPQPKATSQDFPIIGVGASAGGLEAFRLFIEAIPENSGMAYVLVQHLDPGHNSMLSEILTRFTRLPVNEITDNIPLAPDNIYVIPENKCLFSTDGILKLGPRDEKKKNQAIDIFFTSLAEVHLNLAVGVVLSGNGSDGTTGIRAINKHGGITFAQDLSAPNQDMPQNAINSGLIDFILPPSEIPAKLIELFENGANGKTNDANDEKQYQEILNLLRQYKGIDFINYKQTTIRRRILRRMAISKNVNIQGYVTFLREDKSGLLSLFNDLLIPVTEFFRDPKIFQTIKEKVFPAIIANKSEGNTIRVWIAGCSTGEEAFTLAIALHDFLGENHSGTQIQIFASDISAVSIEKARAGFYTASKLKNVPEVLLNRYFIRGINKGINGYQIKPAIRDLCIFAVHNFLKDPPFAKMDLIACRNVLIYMDSFLQKKALTTFHYALKDKGYLLLGKSETTATTENLFLPFDKTQRIYSRKQVSGRFMYRMTNGNTLGYKPENKKIPEVVKIDFKKSAELVLLSRFMPASVVVNEQMEIVHFHGPIKGFLEFSQGKATLNLLKIAKEGLVFELRNAWHKHKETLLPIVKEGIQINDGKNTVEITIEMHALTDTAEPHFLIVFYKTIVMKQIGFGNNLTAEQLYNDDNLKRISQLERELAQIHEDVNAITEEQESSNEELQSANEELLSGSEELQSLNEELETSKEELQSTNEELIIINQELLTKQAQINTSKDYTEAIVATLREPIVILDINLRIKNINRAFSKKYNIDKQEAKGKLIYEIQNHLFDNAPMRVLLEKVLPEKTQLDDYQISVNLQPYGESIMLLNARQVTNESSKEQLILLAIEDITERRNIEKSLQVLSDGLEEKVNERTADLLTSNTDLEGSLTELHNVNVQLQQFAYVASHDLQEPLRKIVTFISILLGMKEKLPEEAIAVLNKISNSSIRMRTLIKDLLAYSYLKADEDKFTATDLNSILKDILTDFELLIEEKEIEIEVGFLPTLNVIPPQMNQLLYNLISNALKFCKNDGTIPKIEVKAKILTVKQVESYPDLNPNVNYWEIVIKDNGIGFDEQYADKIFTIFQRLHNNDIYKGTGIGLAIAKKIIDNHKGFIFSKSKENKGAEFHIILPNRIM